MNHYFSVRKRGLALFAALMMCLSLLPGTALAVEAGETCTYCHEGTVGIDPNDDYQHVIFCSHCEKRLTFESHTFNNGICTVCGRADPNYTGDAGNTHTCTEFDGTDHCKDCGKLNPQHTHNIGFWQPLGGGEHSGYCSSCRQTITETCELKPDAYGYGYNVCSKCGYYEPIEPETPDFDHEHIWKYEYTQGDSKHLINCSVPGCTLGTKIADCVFDQEGEDLNRSYCVCGNSKSKVVDFVPGGDSSCQHVWGTVGSSVSEAAHKVTCIKCLAEETVGCTWSILSDASDQPVAHYCSVCGNTISIRADNKEYCSDDLVNGHEWETAKEVLSDDGKSVLTTLTCRNCKLTRITDICNSPVTVTVHYVDEDGNEVHESIVKPIIKGGDYEITSPTVPGYVPNITVVKGTGASENVVEIVTYRKSETPVKYPLTIKYEYEGGAVAHKPYTAMLANGEEYRVESPTIPNHVPEWSVVEGKMPGADELITVKYTSIHTVTIHYVFADGSEASPDYVQRDMKNGTSYSVNSPAIDGYTASPSVVSGNISGKNVEVTVIYTPDAPETPETPATYTVTIRYQFADGSQAREDYVQAGLKNGDAYSVTSPAIEGYTANRSVVSGSISGGNVVVTVTYTAVTGGNPAPVTPAPTPDDDVTPPVTTITDGTTPLATATIEDEDVPLAGTVGLNTVDHFAYIIGYGDNTVRPLDNISRAEAVTIFFRLMTDEYRTANWSTTNTFADVNAGNWYNNAISTCQKAGALAAFDQDANFLPDQAITRAEFAALAAGFISDEYTGETVGDFSDTEGHWAAAYIRKAVEAGWIAGIGGVFRPDESITRADVMTMVNRMLDRVPDAGHMLPDMITWTDNPEGTSYYEDVQEATNEHAYERDELGITEIWTELLVMRDWEALEKEWADANA